MALLTPVSSCDDSCVVWDIQKAALLIFTCPLQKSPTGIALQVVDRAPIKDGESHLYCVAATGGPLTVTLVWHDYPASTSAAKALVNDLDLSVRAAGLNGFPLLVRWAIFSMFWATWRYHRVFVSHLALWCAFTS